MISVCILTKNAFATLAETLRSVQAFPEVLILDNGSTDETLALGRTFSNVRVHQVPFIGFGPLRNQAAEFAKYEWILALDSDEILSPSLLKEIQSLVLDPNVAYAFPRHNYFRGKRIKGCGWDPERVIRLYHRAYTSFSDSDVHETLLAKRTICLKSPLIHTPYRTTADFLAKMQQYSTLFAKQYQHKKSSSFAKALWHACWTFFWCYFIRRGWLAGSRGFIIASYRANTAFYKYLKLAEANQAPLG